MDEGAATLPGVEYRGSAKESVGEATPVCKGVTAEVANGLSGAASDSLPSEGVRWT
jgi:hypothetical protein